jgi:7-carboxy-7-deazaguanine synthase
MTLEQVMERVHGYPARLVEITGGEPMLQEQEVLELSRRLLDEGYKVLLETSGERNLTRLPPEVIKVMDVKCPGSGEGGRFCVDNLAVLTPQDEVKFVLAGREDYDFAVRFLKEHAVPGPVHFSPVVDKLDARTLADWILKDGLKVRINLQIHKLLSVR